MSVVSGKNGTLTVDGVAVVALSNWTLRRTSNNPSFNTNDTGGSKDRVAGVKDATGTFQQKDAPIVEEGDLVKLQLYTGYTTFDMSAIIDEVSVPVDINDGAEVTYDVAFSGRQAITESKGSAP